jgi:PBSX family phage portal protein
MVARRIQRRSLPSADVRATVFQIKRADSDSSRQIAFNDEFLTLAANAGAQVVMPPPYTVGRLFEIIDQSNMLRQCIDAYVVNTVRTGWEPGSLYRGQEMNLAEQIELESFIEHANSEESLVDVMEKAERDKESVGFGFVEAIRDAMGNVSLLRHAPSLYTRLCPKYPKEVLIEYTIQRGRRVSAVREWRRFRRFVQIVNGQWVYFKEFGDPRRMDYLTGAFENEINFNPARLATEIIHLKNPSAEPYGVPQWINQLPSILGSREAEEVNMRYFQDNTVPPMMLLVGGGRLTAKSFNELNRALNSDIGKDRQNKVLLLEAVGEGDGLGDKSSTIDLKVEKLSDTRQSDGLFRAYDEANMAKVRSSFRLPPITVGMSQDVNFATASTSAAVAESQVFAPARDKRDGWLNKLLVNGPFGLGLKTCKLVSRTPSITSPEMLVKTLTALNVMGAVTPRQAQKVANKTLQVELEPYPEKGEAGYEEWMDMPIPLFIQAKTHEQQAAKDEETKEIEEDGDVGQKAPKNGEQ